VSKPKDDADLEIEAGLVDAVEDGDMEIAGKNEAGETLFRLTGQGRERAEALLFSMGIDPKAAKGGK
jgi:hypothetical protein